MWRRKARRFNLLLLDHGETFIEDHAVQMYPTEALAGALGVRAARFWRGRIHCASASLTFEPEEPDVPLLRVLLNDVEAPLVEWSAGAAGGRGTGNPWDGGRQEATVGEGFVCGSGSVLHKRESNQPFATLRLPAPEPMRFVLLHTRASVFLETMLPVQRSLKDSKAQTALQAQWLQKQENKSFDLTGLVDPLETHILELRVQRVRPMVSTAAILLLTESRLYLQDCFTSDSAPLTHWTLGALVSVTRRRHLLRHTALELRMIGGSGSGSGKSEQPVSSRLTAAMGDSLLVNFASTEDRESMCAQRDPRSGIPRSGIPRSGILRSGIPRSGIPRSGIPRSGIVKRTIPNSGI